MKKLPGIVLLLVLAFMLLFAGCTGDGGGGSPKVGSRAPDFRLQDMSGQTVSLNDFRGKPVLLNFWATWCGPCRGEMPYMEQVYREWKSLGLVLYAVNIGESASQVSDFLDYYILTMPVLLDTGQATATKYAITGIPTTYFIDKDGIIRGKVIGAFPDKESIEPYIREIVR